MSRIKIISALVAIFLATAAGFQLNFGDPFDYGTSGDVVETAICGVCVSTMNLALEKYNNGTPFEVIVEAAIDICIRLDILTNSSCEGVVLAAESDLNYIIDITPDIDGREICGSYLMAYGCVTNNPDRDWTIELPNTTKPAIDETPYDDNVATWKILHLSDTHYDPLYLPGSNANCEDAVFCCRNDSGMPDVAEDGAGFYGDYRHCDAPKWLLEEMYQYISENYNIDYIIVTGDMVPHNVWSTSREETTMILQETTYLISEYFPGVPTYPALGNHDSSPVNTFPQPYIDDPEYEISWLYDELADLATSEWLPAEVNASIRYSGSYTAPVSDDLKLISMNTNYCYGFNWYLIHDDFDVAELLQDLVNDLQESEDAGTYAYIIGHIPSGSGDCHRAWSREFNKIVLRYESTISGIFYGHTHKDHFSIYFDPEDPERPYEIGYIGQGQTPYSEMNPGFKIYTVEGDFAGSQHRVLDHDNYIMDLGLANTIGSTTFFKLYSAKEEYGMPDLSPQSWYDLVLEMNATGSVKFDKFYRNYVKAGPPRLEAGCDDSCKKSVLCRLLVSDSSDNSKCDIL